MSTQDPIASTVPPERPTNPTHLGGDGLYESKADAPDISKDASLQRDSETTESLEGAQGSQGSLWEFAKRNHSIWEFAKRNHVPALLAVGGIVWLTMLVRRSMQRW